MSPYLAIRINVVGLLIISGVLLGAYYVQFAKGEFPCPLCLLQRLGMLGVAFGAMLNLRYGLRPAHYGVSLISAVFGACVSVRQILLHIAPGDAGYGSAVLGLHLYSWAFIVFAAAIVLIGIMMLFDKQFEKDRYSESSGRSPFITAVFFLVILIAVSNVITTFLECGLAQCPDNPVSYIETGK